MKVTIERPDGTKITVEGPDAIENAKQLLDPDRPFKWPNHLAPPLNWPPTPMQRGWDVIS